MTLSKTKTPTAATETAASEAAIGPRPRPREIERLADDQNAKPPVLSVHIISFHCRCRPTIEGNQTRGRRRNCDAERL